MLAFVGLRTRTTSTVSMYRDSVVQLRTRLAGTMTSKASALQTQVTSVLRYLTEAGGTISASLPTSMECIIRSYTNEGKIKPFQDIKYEPNHLNCVLCLSWPPGGALLCQRDESSGAWWDCVVFLEGLRLLLLEEGEHDDPPTDLQAAPLPITTQL